MIKCQIAFIKTCSLFPAHGRECASGRNNIFVKYIIYEIFYNIIKMRAYKRCISVEIDLIIIFWDDISNHNITKINRIDMYHLKITR